MNKVRPTDLTALAGAPADPGSTSLPDWRSPVVWLWPVAALVAAAWLQFTGTNLPMFSVLNRLSHWTGAAPWPAVTVLGDTVVALALFGPLAVRRPHLLWALALSALITAAVVHGLKPLLLHPRPPAVLAPDAITVIGPAYMRKAFPSGHTATAFVAAGLVWMHLQSLRLRIFALVVAVCVGLSRIVVGVHWPLDVLVGSSIGWLSAYAGSWWAVQWSVGHHRTLRRALITVIAACACAALTFLDTGYPQARAVQQSVGALSLGALILAAWRGRRST